MKPPFSIRVKARHVSGAAFCVGLVVAALVFFVLGAGIRLLMGPISLGPLEGGLSQAIRAALPGITLSYDTAALEWDRDRGRVDLVVLGARILDPDGRTVVSAPKAAIGLAAAPLLHGKMAVRQITLVGVSFQLIRTQQGTLRLGAVGGRANDVLARLDDVIEAKNGAASSLRSFAVQDAHLTLHDVTTGLTVRAQRADLSMVARRGGALGTVFNARVTVAGRSAHLKADFTLPPAGGVVKGSASITGLDLRALAAAARPFRMLKSLALTANLSTRFTMAPGGHLLQADFDADAAGAIPLPLKKPQMLPVRQIRLAGSYDGERNRLTLATALLDARGAQVRMKGEADFRYDAKGGLDSIAARLQTNRAAFAIPALFQGAVGLQAIALRGVWHVASRSFTLERFSATAPGFALQAQGTVTAGTGGQAPGVALNGTLAGGAVRALLPYWPLPVAPGARTWIAKNIFAGQAGPFVFETHFAPGVLDRAVFPEDSLKLTFPMSGIEANYLPGLTHLTDVAGTAMLTGDTFTADFTGGKVGPLTVSAGRAVIPSLHVHGTVGEFTAHVDGTMPDIMALIDMPPLGYPARFGIDPKQTRGTAAVDLDIKVPMLAKLKVDDVGIDVEAGVRGFAVSLGKTRLSDGDVHFTITNTSLHQTGTLNLADSRLTVDWLENFQTPATVTGSIRVKGRLTAAGRAALNIGLGHILTGPVGIDATLEENRGQLVSADAQVDLTAATLLVPVVHLQKPEGQPASGHVMVTFGPGNVVSGETVRLSGPELSANGTVAFDKTGALTRVSFPSARMGASTDLSFTLERTPALDTYILRGRSLDGSLIGRKPDTGPEKATATPPPDDTPEGAFRIDARLDRLVLRDGVAISPFALDLSGVGDRPSAVNLSGTLVLGTGHAPISAGLDTTQAGRKLTVRAGNAGALIRGLFAFESLRGGRLDLVATLTGSATDTQTPPGVPDYRGKLDIDDFTMVGQPLLTRLFSAGSLTGLADLMSGSGITLDNLDVPFTSRNGVISITGAAARGPAVGATADGYIDRPHDQVALKGSLIPAYGINSVLGNIPILGDILVSKKGEGVFGITYSATGNADRPNISVNPLSVLTPGILRRIFEGRMPSAANAPSNAPADAQEKTPPAPH